MSDPIAMEPWMLTGPEVPVIMTLALATVQPQDEDNNPNGHAEKFVIVLAETPTGSERYFLHIKTAKKFFESGVKFCTENDIGLAIVDRIPDQFKGGPNAGH